MTKTHNLIAIHRAGRIKSQRAHVIHLHTQLQAWRANRDEYLTDLRASAIAHYGHQKAQALKTLAALIAPN